MILVFGEGVSDIGSEDDSSNQRIGTIPLFVERIVCEKVGRHIPLSEMSIPMTLPHVRVKKRIPGLHGFAQKVIEAAKIAASQNMDGIVVVVDSLGEAPGVRYKALQQGKDHVTDGTRIAIGVAVQEMEAWLLADLKALQGGMSEEAPAQLEKPPEEIRDPKQYFRKLYIEYCIRMESQNKTPLSLAEMRGHVAMHADPKTLAINCPKGFGRFQENIKAEIAPIFQ